MRTETVVINLESEGGHKELDLFVPSKTNSDDNVTVKYTLYLQYFGKVEESLKAIKALKAKGAIVSASVNEITHGECLFANIMKLLNEIKQPGGVETLQG